MPPATKVQRIDKSSTTSHEVVMEQLLQRVSSMFEAMENRMSQQTSQYAETRNLLELALSRITELENRIREMHQPLPPKAQHTHELGTSASIHADKGAEKVKAPPKASFAEAAAKTPVLPPGKKASNSKRPIPVARAVRLFCPPSPTTGYQFVYLSQKGRVPMNEVRRSLSAIGINNSRVLDIHFPARNVCGLLVHNDFVTPLNEALATHNVRRLPDFDPTAASNLMDSKYNELPHTEKTDIAKQIHKTRILRIIDRSPLRVRTSPLTSFQNSGMITRDDWTNFCSSPKVPKGTNTHIVFDSNEVTMEEATPNHDTAPAQ